MTTHLELHLGNFGFIAKDRQEVADLWGATVEDLVKHNVISQPSGLHQSHLLGRQSRRLKLLFVLLDLGCLVVRQGV